MAHCRSERKKVTTSALLEMKKQNEKITMLTAYDFLTAHLIDHTAVDILLVGDSLGNVMLGYDTTLPVTMDEMIHHTKAVARATRCAMVVGDMPFMSYQASEEEAMLNAGRFLKEAGAEAVKLEGGEEYAPLVKKMTDAGIPVMGHLGLTPQSVHQFGGYGLRAEEEKEAKKLISDAKSLEQAGVFSIVFEKIPADLAEKVSKSLKVPTIGIGAGAGCDGQVLVTHDMLGMYSKNLPKFVKQYAKLGEEIKVACSKYVKEVKNGDFPGEEHSY